MRPAWSEIARGSGGTVWRSGDVLAAIVPMAAERSVFNSVFYEEPERLVASLDDLAVAYDAAGVSAWTVWVSPDDPDTAAALERAGHVLDATPRYMGMPLAELVDPPPATSAFEARMEYDPAAMAAMNEIAYGYPAGDFSAVAEAPIEGGRIWFADVDGEAVSTLAIRPHRSDALVTWVATLPEARNQGIARSLLAHALRDARAVGLETTTLQSTKLGAPVYAKLGFRDFGASHMWERRRCGA
jgi:GNAT superfamily N-acetyltransferase